MVGTSSSTLGFAVATHPTYAGELRLKVANTGARTTPAVTDWFGVLRLMRPLYLDDSGQLTYIIVNPGGAYFGEKYRMVIDVEAGAHLLLSSQGATRIYRTPEEPAEQVIDFTLESGSRLEYAPDQTIAYRDADYRQFTTVKAAPDAQGFFAEIVTPGWDPDGAPFTYTAMHLRFDVLTRDGERPVLVDNLRIKPDEIGEALTGIGHMEGNSHMGSVFILGEHTQGAYIDQVRDVVDSSGIGKVAVTAGHRHGVSWLLVRALGRSTDDLHAMISAVNSLDRKTTTGQGLLDLRRY